MKSIVDRILSHPSLAPPLLSMDDGKSMSRNQLLETHLQAQHYVTGETHQDDDVSSQSCRMRHATVHPSLPLVAYCLEDMSSSKRHTIVVQNYQKGDTVFAMGLQELQQALQENIFMEQPISKKKNAVLLPILKLDFFDASTLFYSGMCHAATTTTRALVIQMHRRVVVLNLKPRQRSIFMQNTKTHSQLVLAHITQDTLGGGDNTFPTTSALFVTPQILVVGCMDGSLRFVDIDKNTLVKSARGPSVKKDYPSIIMATNVLSSNKKTAKRKLVLVSQRGIACLWEFEVDGNSIEEIYPPVARMEGYPLVEESTTWFSWKEQLHDSSSPSVSEHSATTEVASFMQHTQLEYDAHRNLLYWFVPSGYQKSSRAHLLCWNLSIRIRTLPKDKTIPQHEPFLVVALPKELTMTITGVAGWLHPAFSDSNITCAIATHGGEVFLVSCSTNNNNNHKTRVMKDPTIVHYVNLASSLTMPSQQQNIHIHSIHTCRIFDTTSLLLNTNVGLLSLRFCLEDSFPSAGSTLHQFLLESPQIKTDTGCGSVLWVQNQSVYWAPLEKSATKDPVGHIRIRNPPVLVYKSPVFGEYMQLQQQQHQVRLPPRFLKSPSEKFVCLFWQSEQRFEILHISSLLQRRTNTPTAASSEVYSPAVATGTDILSFAWVGNDDHFVLLHSGSEQAPGISTLSLDTTVTTTVSSASSVSSAGSSSNVRDHHHGGKLRIRKSFNFNKIEKVMQRTKSNLTPTAAASPLAATSPMAASTPEGEPVAKKLRVELKVLVGVTAGASEISGSIAAATATTLGDIALRGGNRSPPTTLFGGPVLCVASRSGETAHFYARRSGDAASTPRATNASDYVSSGPVLPFPDMVEWNDDGRLCAVVVGTRVAVYLSEQPVFALLGTARILGGSSPMDQAPAVTSVKFVHGVLYCATRSSVQCIFLGDLDREDRICHFDNFLLASKDVATLPSRTIVTDDYTSWSPPSLPMALNHPSILGYHRGSLLLSTVSGLQAVPLKHPLLRIGSLLAAGHHEHAQKWLQAFPESDHESLAAFLDRRGVPGMAVNNLSGLSIETIVDFCLRHELTERLVQLIETHGLDSIRRIDMGRGMRPWAWGQDRGEHSLVVCVCAFLLSQGKAELVRTLAAECMQSKEGKQDAFCVATLLLAVDQNDARRLMKRALATPTNDQDTDLAADWPVAGLIRDKIL